MPHIFAADAEKPGDSSAKKLSKKRFCEDGCSKETCNRRNCKDKVRSSVIEIGGVEK